MLEQHIKKRNGHYRVEPLTPLRNALANLVNAAMFLDRLYDLLRPAILSCKEALPLYFTYSRIPFRWILLGVVVPVLCLTLL